ncbi:hypothetical protein CJ030_MR1G006147 [Morella rubra]|uniref:PGG domain-containing protein n=1 Tax=Morella rubra TaxID=262757 RepID=A0A6A1WQM4_9ROSI|nr:hypothetical protein CJ030_MR1G006147 [Morella rubra]
MNFVEKVLDKCPLLLRQTNANGETLLHIAAKYGHSDIVDFLIERARIPNQDLESGIEPVKEMLRKTNKKKDTALHEAVRYNHFEVVRKLVNEDPDFSYLSNDGGETPLYMAIERRHPALTFVIMDTCKSPAYGGPLGRTALHAAVLTWDDTADHKGWTLLHIAAYLDSSESAKQLLKFDRHIAYMKDAKGRIALHIAAHRGQFFVGDHPRVDLMAFNQRNLNAVDTAVTFSENESFVIGLRSVDLRLPQRILEDEDEDEIKEHVKEREKKREERLQKESGSDLVMATLITTVTFAAGITMPRGFVGGEGPHSGSAILTKSTAFKAFVITDVISMVLSSCSVLIYLLLPSFDENKSRLKFFHSAWRLNLVAMVAMDFDDEVRYSIYRNARTLSLGDDNSHLAFVWFWLHPQLFQ